MNGVESKKVLIFHQGALGDFIALFPALALLRERYRSIDAICQGSLGDLAIELKIIDSRFPLETTLVSSLFSSTVHPKMKEKLERYHTVILFSYSDDLERSVLSSTDRAVYRIDPRPGPDRSIHVTSHLLSNLAGFGLIGAAAADSGSGADRRIERVDPARILLHPGSGSPLKNWPVSNFIQIARMLRAAGKRPAFVLGPAEDDLAADLIPCPDAVFHRPNDLIDLARLLRTASGFIGNDSGVSHLSGYLGVPTVAIFGPSDPLKWRPLGRAVSIVQAAGCRPCFESEIKRSCRRECIEEISPERVLKAYEEL